MHKRGSGKPFREPSGSWAFRWRENGRLRYSGGHPSRQIAERALAVIQGQIALERSGLPPDATLEVRLEDVIPAWLKRREATHRAGDSDRGRWNKHLKPHFGHLRPSEVDVGAIRRFVEAKHSTIAQGTTRVCVSILSSAFEDMIEQRLAASNPCRNLPRSIRRMMQPDHDPTTTPFLKRLDDVGRVYRALPPPLHVAFAIGAMAGLRTGEVFALRWAHLDLGGRRIHVRESVKGPLKDKESRIAPILDGLFPVLTAWKLETGSKGLVIPPMRCDGEHMDKETPGKHLRRVLTELELMQDQLEYRQLWYRCTRHTFASQWVMQGGSIEKLSKILGHYSIAMTERYAHLRPDLFVDAERSRIPADLVQKTSSEPQNLTLRHRNYSRNAGAVL